MLGRDLILAVIEGPPAFLLAAAACGAVVGLALGLTGAGGSIFAVPLLIYALAMPPEVAMPMSLVAVALTAAVGAAEGLRRKGKALWRPAVLFAAGGVTGAPLGLAAGAHAEPGWLVAGFGVLALAVGGSMWHKARVAPEEAGALRALSHDVGSGPGCALEPEGALRLTTRCALALALTGLGTALLKAQHAPDRPGRALADEGRRREIAALLSQVERKLHTAATGA